MKNRYVLLLLLCAAFQVTKSSDIPQNQKVVKNFFERARMIVTDSDKAYKLHSGKEIQLREKKKKRPEVLWHYNAPSYLDFGRSFSDANKKTSVFLVRFYKNGNLDMQYTLPSQDKMLKEDTTKVSLANNVTFTAGHSPINEFINMSKREINVRHCSKTPLFPDTLRPIPALAVEEHPEGMNFFEINDELRSTLTQWLTAVEKQVIQDMQKRTTSEQKTQTPKAGTKSK